MLKENLLFYGSAGIFCVLEVWRASVQRSLAMTRCARHSADSQVASEAFQRLSSLMKGWPRSVQWPHEAMLKALLGQAEHSPFPSPV